MKSEWRQIGEGCYVRQCGKFRLSLICFYEEGKPVWRVTCSRLFCLDPMASPVLEEAQNQASAHLQVVLEQAIKEITG